MKPRIFVPIASLAVLAVASVALPSRAESNGVHVPADPNDPNAHTKVVVGDASISDRKLDERGDFHSFDLSWNPLAVAIGRFSVDFEWAPVEHHVLLVSPHLQHAESDFPVSPTTTGSSSFNGAGAELGYRYYTGHRGMNGFFVGPSLLVGAYSASLPNGSVGYNTIGVAFDVGAKVFLFRDLSLGAGVGIQYLHVSHDFGDLSRSASTIASEGISPRLLASIGYAF